MSIRKILGIVASAAIAFSVAGKVQAQSAAGWPNHPIKLIVPSAAGGSSDAVGRIIADGLTKALGQPVVVMNVPGTASILGISYVARSDPDGYTILISSASLVIDPLLQKVPFDWERDFTPITQLTTSGHVIVVNPEKLPVKTLPELVKVLKENPGKYFYGSSGVGSTPHMNSELFMSVSGTKMTHVPFKSSGESATALLGGEVQVVTDTMQSVLTYVKTGKVLPLAVTTAQRAPEMPNVPSINEYYPNFPPADLWLGISVRKGTPQPIVDRLNKAIADYIHTPEGVARLATTGSRPVGSTPTEFAARLKSESGTWAKVIKEANIKVE